MVTISDVRKSKNSTTNEEFISLVLSGEVELVLSKISGKMYATARTCMITSTFSEEIAKTLIGKQLPGTIEKVPCEPYDYVVPETSEIIRLEHTYQYVAEGEYPINQKPSPVQANPSTFSTNGVGNKELVTS